MNSGQSRIPKFFRFGIFELDVRAGELRKNGVKLKLQEQPFQILCALVEHPGELVTREELRHRLWPVDTFVDFDHSLNAAIKRLRDALGESADAPVFIETMARRGYRFIAPYKTEVKSPEENLSTDAAERSITHSAGVVIGRKGLHWKLMVPSGFAVVALAVGSYFYLHHTPKLTEKDTIVLADFQNNTGDAVFDDTLKQGLRVQLERNESYPQHTIIQRYWLPISRAAVALENKNAVQAVELLRATAPYELAAMGVGSLEPIYLRGQAYLMQHNGSAALVEFRKILDHPGL